MRLGFFASVLRAFRPGSTGEVLLDASYREHTDAQWLERGLLFGAAFVAAVSLGLREPWGAVAVAALVVGAIAARLLHPTRTIVFYEFVFVLETQTLMSTEGMGAWRIEYEWIDAFMLDGDRLNLWLDELHPLGAVTRGVVVQGEHQRDAMRILTERHGEKLAAASRG